MSVFAIAVKVVVVLVVVLGAIGLSRSWLAGRASLELAIVNRLRRRVDETMMLHELWDALMDEVTYARQITQAVNRLVLKGVLLEVGPRGVRTGGRIVKLRRPDGWFPAGASPADQAARTRV